MQRWLRAISILISFGITGAWAAHPTFTISKLGGNSGLLGDMNSFSQLAFGPDGNLYATRTQPGQVWRFKVDTATGLLVGQELLLDQAAAGDLINGLAFDPSATIDNLIFYYSQVSEGGKIYRVKAGPWGGTRVLKQTLLIDKIGIFGNHATNNMTFAKNGLLYITLSGQSYAGTDEKPWTAAIGEVNLAHAAFNNPPVDISNTEVLGDTVYNGSEPIKLFATGLRNPNGILQHSNGLLYGTAHDPYDSDNILNPNGIGLLNNATTRIPDLLVRLEKGKYYGHTNATRKQFLYFGGNPTSGVDPFEVPELPVGTKTAMDMKLVLGIDHHMCIGGLDEYVDGSLLVTYVKQDNTPIGHVEWFDLDQAGYFIHPNAGDIVTKHAYIQDQAGKTLEFGGVLDVLVTPKGWVYVADFGYRTGDGGTGDIAGLYLLKPTSVVGVRKPLEPSSGSFSKTKRGIAFNLSNNGFTTIERLDLKGTVQEKIFSGNLSSGAHVVPCPARRNSLGIELFRVRVGGFTQTLKFAPFYE